MPASAARASASPAHERGESPSRCACARVRLTPARIVACGSGGAGALVAPRCGCVDRPYTVSDTVCRRTVHNRVRRTLAKTARRRGEGGVCAAGGAVAGGASAAAPVTAQEANEAVSDRLPVRENGCCATQAAPRARGQSGQPQGAPVRAGSARHSHAAFATGRSVSKSRLHRSRPRASSVACRITAPPRQCAAPGGGPRAGEVTAAAPARRQRTPRARCQTAHSAPPPDAPLAGRRPPRGCTRPAPRRWAARRSVGAPSSVTKRCTLPPKREGCSDTACLAARAPRRAAAAGAAGGGWNGGNGSRLRAADGGGRQQLHAASGTPPPWHARATSVLGNPPP